MKRVATALDCQKSNTLIAIFLVTLSLTLISCASQPELKFYNKNLLSLEKEKTQFTVDHGYCTQVSYGSVRMPDVRVYIPPSSTTAGASSTTTGTFDVIEPSTGRLSTGSMTMHTQSTPRYDIAGSVDRGIATASAMAALSAQSRAEKARLDIYCGCMAKLGWTEGEKPASLLADQISTDGFKVLTEDPSLASSMATQALSIDPNNFHSLYLAGMARESLNDDDHAIASLQRATEIKQDSDVTSFIGYIYLYKKNDAEKAISFLSQAVNINPENARAYYALADAYVSLHDVKKAKEAYFRMNEIDKELANDFLDKLKKSMSE